MDGREDVEEVVKGRIEEGVCVCVCGGGEVAIKNSTVHKIYDKVHIRRR